jgi:hypothetical protein
VVGEWRRLHNEVLHNLCSSPNVMRIIKKEIKWMGHVACMEQMRNVYKIWSENLKGRDHSQNVGTSGIITVEWILEK